jgi:hypothetical protein
MTITWNRQAAAAAGQIVSAAAVAAPPAAPGPGTTTTIFSPQDAAAAQQRAKSGLLLSQLYGYLRDNAEQHPRLAAAIPLLSSAVAEYRTGQAQDPIAGVRSVYAAIETVRRADPSIPEP